MNNNPEEQDKGNKLEELYESTSEDLEYGIGIVWLPDEGPTPIIQIHYRDWSCQKLEVVRGSFRGGIVLDGDRRMGGAHAVYISTREKITLQTKRNGHTSILRAPAWDAHLANVEEVIFSHFECERSRHGGFQLMIQTREWEFLTTVDEARDRTIVGDVLPHSLPTPQGNTTI